MPERARAVAVARDEDGNIIANATITLKQPGTSTNIAGTIYVNDDPDASTYTNGAFFSAATGIVKFFLTDEQRVDMLVEKTGFTSQTIPIDVQKSSRTGVTTIQDEGSAETERAIVNFIGAGVDVADDAANGRTNVAIAAADLATATLWDAKGDLAVGTGADTAQRLAVGANGSIPVADSGAATGLAWRLPATNVVATAESTTSTTFTDLATVGPAVTTTIGASGLALVIFSALIWQGTADGQTRMAVAVSGATTRAAQDAESLYWKPDAVSNELGASRAVLISGLTAGSNTFTAKYRVSLGTGNWQNRSLIVIPL